MALSEKTNLLVTDYTRQQYPQIEEGVRRYIQEELRRIETSIGTLIRSSVQVADDPPENPVKGMIRYAVSPWNPGSGDGFTFTTEQRGSLSKLIGIYNMVWGQVAGAVVGGYMANQAAKKQAGAIDAANRMSNMGYLDAQPYINFGYSGGKGALQDVLNTGAYTGPTYAGLNAMQTGALDNQFGFGANSQSIWRQNLAATGAGFGSNYNDLYNQAMGGQALDNAINYATANRGGLVDAALRDSTRQLTQQTLPGINRAASATGNTNSSRAGIADAMAMRDYQDRAADVSSDITNQLVNQSLTQQQRDFANAMNANRGLSSAFTTGLTLASKD